MPTKTQLCPPLSAIPIVEPHLMPFHIDYSGSAPISTYFLIKPDSTPNDEQPNTLQRLKNRFISAFRGRRLKGLAMDIPEGYVGVILRGDDENDSSANVLPKKRPSSPPTKRKKTRRNTVVEIENREEEDVGMEGIREQLVETRILRPVGRFDSFTIWNPDVEIDETNDEYIRALTGYQQLLAEVHRTQPISTTTTA